MANGHGGARLGAGRKPNRLRKALPVQMAEQKLVDHLPALVDKALELAAAGDRFAVEYCINRILGRPTERREDTSEVRVIRLDA